MYGRVYLLVEDSDEDGDQEQPEEQSEEHPDDPKDCCKDASCCPYKEAEDSSERQAFHVSLLKGCGYE